jgi:hypothetical protein
MRHPAGLDQKSEIAAAVDRIAGQHHEYAFRLYLVLEASTDSILNVRTPGFAVARLTFARGTAKCLQ